MIIHYNCTIGSILLDSFLLIYHPYPPSFHEMIFILVPSISAPALGEAGVVELPTGTDLLLYTEMNET